MDKTLIKLGKIEYSGKSINQVDDLFEIIRIFQSHRKSFHNEGDIGPPKIVDLPDYSRSKLFWWKPQMYLTSCKKNDTFKQKITSFWRCKLITFKAWLGERKGAALSQPFVRFFLQRRQFHSFTTVSNNFVTIS